MREDLLPVTKEGKLDRIIEECGEVLQVIGKIKRFGWKAKDQKTGIEYDNEADFKSELSDLKHAIAQIENEFS